LSNCGNYLERAMTDAPRLHERPLGHQPAPAQPDFDLVEDYGAADANDQAAFDRALNALLPQEGTDAVDGAGGVDIDLDDFEAFNRELDARLAEARAHPADEAIEDLGAEIIPTPPTLTPAADVPAAPAGPEDLAEDVVTLGAAGVVAAAAIAPPRAPAATPAVAPAPSVAPPAPRSAPASASAEATAPAARRTGSGWALTLGIAGLLTGGTGLWLHHASQGDLARLQDTLARNLAATPPTTPLPAAPNVAPALDHLDARVTELARAVEALGANAKDGNAAVARVLGGLEERLARAEAQLAAAKAPETTAKATTTEPAMPLTSPTPATGKAPVSEPPNTPAAAEPAKPAAPMIAAAPEPSKPAADKPKPAPEAAPPAPTATAAKAKKPLPQAAGGAWAVVVESFATEADAYKRLNRVENAGLVADVIPAQINNQTWHRVVVPGYASQEEAKAIAAELKGRGLGQPWVYQRKGD
jgi:cell division septation protein DedD